MEPFDEYPFAPEMTYFLGQSYGTYVEKCDAREKLEAAIAALKRVGSVALRSKVLQLEEQLLNQVKKEKDVHVLIKKREEIQHHYKESAERMDSALTRYIDIRRHHKRMKEREQTILAKQELLKRIDQAEEAIHDLQSKGQQQKVEELKARVDKLKMLLKEI